MTPFRHHFHQFHRMFFYAVMAATVAFLTASCNGLDTAICSKVDKSNSISLILNDLHNHDDATPHPVTLLFTGEEWEDVAEIDVVEVDNKGREMRRIKDCTWSEQVLALPQIVFCRRLQFAPPAGKGLRHFRFEARCGSAAVSLPKENLFPSGDFEGKGWGFGNFNPVTSYVDGRHGGKALQIDLREKNTGGPVNAWSYPQELLKLKDPANLPALMRVFIRTVAGGGNGDGMTVRMRRFTDSNKYLDNYHVWSIQGGLENEWIERRIVLQKPLAVDTGKLDVYLVNMAPQDGVCFQLDDMEILPIKTLQSVIEIAVKNSEVIAGQNVTINATIAETEAGNLLVHEVPLSMTFDGESKHIMAQLVETKRPTLSGGTLAVEMRKDGKLFLSKTVALSENGGEFSVCPPVGDYKIVATVRMADGKALTRQFDCQVLDTPFAEGD